MYADVIWDLKIYMFLRQGIWSTNKILKEIAVLECENAKKILSSLAALAHIFIDIFSMSVFCQYVAYSAI